MFAPLGLANGRLSMLVVLSGKWQPRMGELAEVLAMDATTMTAASKALAKRGPLQLVADQSDGRARRPALTDQGRIAVAAAVPLWCEENAKLQAEAGINAPAALAKILAQLG